MLHRPLASVLVLLLAACGGGGGSSGGGTPTPVYSLSYVTPQVFTVSTAITAVTPAVTGGPEVFTASPGLPTGLVLNPATGMISGTPANIQAATTYTITAANLAGTASTTAPLVISVKNTIPVVSYPRASYTYMVGIAAGPVVATYTTQRGEATTWTISPALPDGLTLNASTGEITGTPTTVTARRTHTVSATNSGGTGTFNIDFEVKTATVIDLGHTTDIVKTTFSGNRVLSVDTSRRFNLWNAQTGALLVSVQQGCTPPAICAPDGALAGSTFVVRQGTRLAVYSATDGSLISEILRTTGFDTFWVLATDGSYLVQAGSAGLRALTPQGTLLFTRAGSYLAADTWTVFAAPNEVRVANGAAGLQVIETLAVPGGAATTSTPFPGSFTGWFVDGEKFFAGAANTIGVYSRNAAQLDLATLPNRERMGGMGEWYWTGSLTTRLYRVGSAGVTTATYANTSTFIDNPASGGALAVTTQADPNVAPTFSVIDLTGATPAKADYVTPALFPVTFAAASPADWVAGTAGGVVMGELSAASPLLYSQGAVRSIAGSDTRVAYATTAGKVRIYNAATSAFESEIDWPSSKVALSSDGTLLAAAGNFADSQYAPDRTLRIYSLPSRTLLHQRPATRAVGVPFPSDFQLSTSGQVVAQRMVTLGSPATTFDVTQLDGTPIASIAVNPPQATDDLFIRLSPSGTRFAIPDRARDVSTGTNLYLSGVLTGVATGSPAGWLDADRLLINRYSGSGSQPPFAGADIVGPTGVIQTSPALSEVQDFQLVGTNRIYDTRRNIIFDTVTGDAVWTSPATPAPVLAFGPGLGAVAGTNVWFVSGATLRVEAR